MRSLLGLRVAVTVAIALAGLSGCGDDDADPVAEPPGEPTAAPAWSYGGSTGPAAWGDLSPDYATCGSGRAQSPIDLVGAEPQDRGPLGVDYGPAPARLLDTGHTIEVEFDDGGGSLELGGESYELSQLHFHGPSEHLVEGESHPLEIHLVHESADGALAVVAALVAEGEASEAIAPLVAAIPEVADGAVSLGDVDASTLLPDDRAFFHYQGSLTTPPCTEDVAWSVLTTPITASDAQIDAVTSSLREPNNRPVQDLGDRPLALDESG
jgi:carbonic anhydrase